MFVNFRMSLSLTLASLMSVSASPELSSAVKDAPSFPEQTPPPSVPQDLIPTGYFTFPRHIHPRNKQRYPLFSVFPTLPYPRNAHYPLHGNFYTGNRRRTSSRPVQHYSNLNARPFTTSR